MLRIMFAVGAVGFIALSAPAAVVSYQASLSGANESPPNTSLGTGFTIVDIDTTAHTLRVQANFSGLTGLSTNCHIHSNATITPGVGNAGVATMQPTFLGFPSGVTAGVYDNTFDLTLASSWNSAYITANGGTPASAEAALALQMSEGRSYLNIHSSFAAGGEIRGFLTPVPTPGAAAVLGLGALVARRRRR